MYVKLITVYIILCSNANYQIVNAQQGRNTFDLAEIDSVYEMALSKKLINTTSAKYFCNDYKDLAFFIKINPLKNSPVGLTTFIHESAHSIETKDPDCLLNNAGYII